MNKSDAESTNQNTEQQPRKRTLTQQENIHAFAQKTRFGEMQAMEKLIAAMCIC
jgi:hypothetical protein